MLIVKIPFVGHGYNMPNVGELINPDEPIRSYLIEINVAEPYETAAMPPPRENKSVVKKKVKKQSRKRKVTNRKR